MEHLLPDIRYDEAMTRLGGNRGLYITLLKKFNVSETVRRVLDKVGSGAHGEAVAEVHALIGASSNLSLALLAGAARTLEQALIAGIPITGEADALEAAAAGAIEKINILLDS